MPKSIYMRSSLRVKMEKYWVVSYLEDTMGVVGTDKLMRFFRTTSPKLLNRKIEEVKEKGYPYGVMTMKGHNITFN